MHSLCLFSSWKDSDDPGRQGKGEETWPPPGTPGAEVAGSGQAAGPAGKGAGRTSWGRACRPSRKRGSDELIGESSLERWFAMEPERSPGPADSALYCPPVLWPHLHPEEATAGDKESHGRCSERAAQAGNCCEDGLPHWTSVPGTRQRGTGSVRRLDAARPGGVCVCECAPGRHASACVNPGLPLGEEPRSSC